MRRPPLLHDGIIACMTRMEIDPWTVGAVVSTLNDATLQHDNAELGHHPHRDWLCTYSIYVFYWVMLLFLILRRYADDHDFDILSIVLSLLLCINSVLFVVLLIWDWRLTRSRLERSIAVQQQALQEEFDGAMVMSLDDRAVLLEFRRVDANPTPITAIPIV